MTAVGTSLVYTFLDLYSNESMRVEQEKNLVKGRVFIFIFQNMSNLFSRLSYDTNEPRYTSLYLLLTYPSTLLNIFLQYLNKKFDWFRKMGVYPYSKTMKIQRVPFFLNRCYRLRSHGLGLRRWFVRRSDGLRGPSSFGTGQCEVKVIWIFTRSHEHLVGVPLSGYVPFGPYVCLCWSSATCE